MHRVMELETSLVRFLGRRKRVKKKKNDNAKKEVSKN